MDEKWCNRCKQTLPIELFAWKNKEKGWRQGFCKPCNIQANKEHYQANKKSYKDKAKKWDRENNPVGKYSYEYKSSHPCVDCGESNPVCLDFDHRDRESKIFSISKAVSRRVSWKKILEEIEKCDVRCKNCHAKRTAIQFDWYSKYAPLE